MIKRRVTRTTIKASEVYVIKGRRGSGCGSCGECGSALVSLENAVLLARASSRTIHRWMERKEVHFVETPDGLALLCTSSLLEHIYTHHGSSIG